MSLDSLIAGLQLHGIGCEQTKYGYKIGFVMPEDINVAVKYNKDFDTYVNKYKEMEDILNDLSYANAIVKKTSLSKHVFIYGGIPAYGTWACYEVDVKLNPTSSLARRLSKLIPTEF